MCMGKLRCKGVSKKTQDQGAQHNSAKERCNRCKQGTLGTSQVRKHGRNSQVKYPLAGENNGLNARRKLFELLLC